MTKIEYTPDGRLTDKAEYGQHVGLTCRNHPNLSWNTKNIAPLGCRTIFFNGDRKGNPAHECDCALHDLELM